ncbi:MAG: 30S ribosomal protein S12 methylthiotransferase RimO [Candidatus Omnitrophica bacterium]|nr:30S ribosomal protein S12 methylthiotransferase RimO [Candidatus Omnitrophota bacterium]
MSTKTKVGILSLGCPRNIVDSEGITSRLYLKNFQIVDINQAEIAIINTCAFLKEAVEESIDKILDLVELKKQGRLRKIIVSGCLPSRYKSQLIHSLPEIDAFIGPQKLSEKNTPILRLTPKHYSYVKITEGCLNKCSFCIIPKLKGKFASRSIESILEEIQSIDINGKKEIDIIGQDISQYGLDLYKEYALDRLLANICKKLKYIKWIRLLYLHPSHITDELIRVVAGEKAICKYIDLPLQHINDVILKRMNRQISKRQIINLIENIRKEIPDVAIRTSFIIGFPGETDKQFKELLKFIEEMRFERLGVFLYSREEDTPAYHFKEQIPEKVKRRRFDELMGLQQSVASSLCRESLNTTCDVIIDEKCKDDPDTYLGRTSQDAPEVDGVVYVKAKDLKIGDIVSVRITDSLEYDLIGEVV